MFSIRNWLIPTFANNYRAYLLTNKALVIYLLALIVINLFGAGLGISKSYALIDLERVIELHNRERVANGLGTLEPSYTLYRSALAKGEVMLEYDCWSHYCPEGTSPWEFFREEGYSYAFAGENLAEGFTDSETMMQAWMNSKSHRENVLKPEFTEIGVAMVIGDFQGIRDNAVVVVHFARPKANYESEKFPGAQREVAQSFNSGTVAITKPEPDSFVSDSTPEISGEAEEEVLVELGEEQGSVLPEGGIFTFESANALEDGPTQAKASNEFGEASVSFTIDTQAPEIDLSKAEKDPETGNVYLTFSESISSVDASVPVYRVTDKIWELELASANLEEINLTIADLAGNELASTIEKQQLDNLPEVQGDLYASPISSRELSGDLGDRLAGFSTGQIIVVAATLFMLLLFVLDWVVISKTKQRLVDRKRSRTQLHVAALGILLVVALIGNLSGNI
ncbi:MAG: CAP domain-containing protein [Candidatus Dojkabacteria bacterium]